MMSKTPLDLFVEELLQGAAPYKYAHPSVSGIADDAPKKGSTLLHTSDSDSYGISPAKSKTKVSLKVSPERVTLSPKNRTALDRSVDDLSAGSLPGRLSSVSRPLEPERAEQPGVAPPAAGLLASWPCPHCGNLAEIEGVEPSLDGQRTLTFWCCEPCQTVGVTPDTPQQPPVWVPRTEQ